MLNYISAEFYKLGQRWSFYLSLAALLVLEELTLWSFRLEGASSEELQALFLLLSPVGLFLVIVCTNLVFSNQYRHDTLKNELASGISRTRIYLGKLSASFLVALLFCAAVCVVYLKNAWLVSDRMVSAIPTLLWRLLPDLAAVFPLWLGMLSLSFCLMSLLRETALTVLLLFGFLIFGSLFLWLLCMINWPWSVIRRLIAALYYAVPMTPFFDLGDPINAGMLSAHWAVGLGWVLVSTLVGLCLFYRREI